MNFGSFAQVRIATMVHGICKLPKELANIVASYHMPVVTSMEKIMTISKVNDGFLDSMVSYKNHVYMFDGYDYMIVYDEDGHVVRQSSRYECVFDPVINDDEVYFSRNGIIVYNLHGKEIRHIDVMARKFIVIQEKIYYSHDSEPRKISSVDKKTGKEYKDFCQAKQDINHLTTYKDKLYVCHDFWIDVYDLDGNHVQCLLRGDTPYPIKKAIILENHILTMDTDRHMFQVIDKYKNVQKQDSNDHCVVVGNNLWSYYRTGECVEIMKCKFK